MAELVLYDSPSSSNALKVRFALAALELPYERRPVPIGRPRPDWYLALNPRGLIPTLLDARDLALSESHAILRYLAGRERRDDLYPLGDGASRARVDEFLDWFATGIRPALHRHELLMLGWTPEGGLGSGPTDPVLASRVAEEIAPMLRVVDALVSEEGAVLGRFTIADCAIAPVLNRTRYTGLDLAPYPSLMGLRDRLVLRPGFLAAEPVR
jgi:glutathione S-transferase